jgi:BASS family bile acid:Na+ symporter
MNEIDAVRLNFSPESLVVLDLILAFVLFGVALDIKVADFKGIVTAPRGTLIGLLAHSVLLPAVAFALTMILQPAPSIALGMILVASCPSGNISNFLVNYGRGNTALSVTIAAFSMLGSIFFTPFNLSFWGELNRRHGPSCMRSR